MPLRRFRRPATGRPTDWHREAVGGMWDEIGPLERDFLVEHGLRPSHTLLDVGCGSLRGGVHLIAYLEPGHYVGVDKDPELVEAGRTIELPRYGVADRAPALVVMDDFGFERLGRRFDVALAVSVFTHLPVNDILRCIVNVDRCLVPGGVFFATFFENPAGKANLDPIPHPGGDRAPIYTFFDKDPFHYDLDTFRWLCGGTGLSVEYIGDWRHPRDQKMLAFVKEGAAPVLLPHPRA